MYRAVMRLAVHHLRRVDAILKSIIDRYGPCTLTPRKDYFSVLADSIVSQQISVKAAETIFRRLKVKMQGRVTPGQLLKLSVDDLRSAGVSGQKSSYLRDLAEKWVDGTILPRRFSRMDDEAIIAMLTKVHGIGRWTAEMFLIFSLNRLDVLPVDDLGFQRAVQHSYGCRAFPSARTIRRIAEPWRPYRSIATWYLWRSLDNELKKGDNET